MADLVVLYDMSEDGRPVPVLSSGDPAVLAEVSRVFARRLSSPSPERVLKLTRSAPEPAG